MARDVGIDIHGLGPLDHFYPLRGISRAHCWEDSVQIGLTHEKNFFFREMDYEISTSMGASKEEDLNRSASEFQYLTFVDDLAREHDWWRIYIPVRCISASLKCGC